LSWNSHSTAAQEFPGPGEQVFKQLLGPIRRESAGQELDWELRVSNGSAENAFSLPDGAVYVSKSLAQILAKDPGLWAAVLAHEIVHIQKHHWAKRASFEKSLEEACQGRGWLDGGIYPVGLIRLSPDEKRTLLAGFLRELERDADFGSLDLMAQNGFHPGFVVSLYHLMEAQEGSSSAGQFLSSHPGWNIREAEIQTKYAAAVAKFERLWPHPADSPGGAGPALAFLGRPEARVGVPPRGLEIRLPLRCEHTQDPVDVVLLVRRWPLPSTSSTELTGNLRLTTACPSHPTEVSFDLRRASAGEELNLEFYVMDQRGWVLGRSSELHLFDGN